MIITVQIHNHLPDLDFVLFTVNTVDMQYINIEHSSSITIPLYTSLVSAGFPSPADDHINKKIDLNELLIRHPAATFMARAEGNSMIDAGILSGDLLIIDRALTPKSGDIVLAVCDGGYLVKRLLKKQDRYFLYAENKNHSFKPTLIDQDVTIWGVVSGVVRSTK
jgi:DNA polymerase V